MTDEQLDQIRTFTDKEVMSSAIATLRGLTLNELLKTKDEREKKILEERQLLLEYEKMAVLGDDEIAKSIQDKVNRLYAPMLKGRVSKRTADLHYNTELYGSIMADKRLEQIRTFTKKEVMSSAINELRGYIIRELSSVTDDEKREELMKRQRLLAFEANVVLGDDEMAQSVQDKVLRLYSPILKRLNKQE